MGRSQSQQGSTRLTCSSVAGWGLVSTDILSKWQDSRQNLKTEDELRWSPSKRAFPLQYLSILSFFFMAIATAGFSRRAPDTFQYREMSGVFMTIQHTGWSFNGVNLASQLEHRTMLSYSGGRACISAEVPEWVPSSSGLKSVR